MQYSEIITVFSPIHSKYTSTFSGKKVDFLKSTTCRTRTNL